MALPIYLHFKEKNVSKNPQIVTRHILHECSYQLFDHICKCIRTFGESNNKVARARFFVSHMPSRTYQYAVIDKSLIYNEYYQIEGDGSSLPSFVISNSVHNDPQMLQFLNIYKKELDDHILDERFRLDRESVIEQFEFLLLEYRVQLSKGKSGKYNKSRNKLRIVVNKKVEVINRVFGLDFPLL